MEIEAAVPFELSSLEDLVRWVVSSSQGQQGTIFYFQKEGKHVFSTFIVLPGYYNFQGLPVLLMTEHSNAPEGAFLRFDIRHDADKTISYTAGFDDRDSNLGYIQYLPVIKLDKIPPIFNT